MVKFFRKLFGQDVRKNFINAQEASKEPWAMFEVSGKIQGEKVKVNFSWNEAFIEELNAIGFAAESPEETVQLFFFAAQMRPMGENGDETVQSPDLPHLSPNVNRIVG